VSTIKDLLSYSRAEWDNTYTCTISSSSYIICLSHSVGHCGTCILILNIADALTINFWWPTNDGKDLKL